MIKVSNDKINLDLSKVDIKAMIEREPVIMAALKKEQKKDLFFFDESDMTNRTLLQDIANLGQSSVVK